MTVFFAGRWHRLARFDADPRLGWTRCGLRFAFGGTRRGSEPRCEACA